MVEITQSDRLQAMPPYIFSEINALKAAAQKRGMQLMSLAIGDPDQPTPQMIVEKIVEAARKPSNHLYSPYEGTLAFRMAVRDWFAARFGVSLDAEKEIIGLIGSKEGIAHFPLAFLNPGDKVLYPSPGYPVFETCVLLAGGVPVPMPHTKENGFLPDVNKLEELVKEHRPRFMILNYPSNPTTVTVPKETLTEMVEIARRYGTYIVYDNAYSEIYYDQAQRPPSILEIPGARDVAIEFHSFSKTFNMTGWRIAYAVGNEKLVAGLLRAKTNIDSGPLLAVQDAAIFALRRAPELTYPIRQVYAERRKAVLEGLDALGIEYVQPNATFFVWARVPNGQPSMEFTKALIENHGLVVTPGMGFGKEGEGFFRLALTVDVPNIHEALKRMGKYLGR